jgi:hypothetical protein
MRRLKHFAKPSKSRFHESEIRLIELGGESSSIFTWGPYYHKYAFMLVVFLLVLVEPE